MIKTIMLKKNREFMKLYKKATFFAGRYIVLYFIKNYLDVNRLGITVSKKIGKSVKRNRVRRLIKENYRDYELFIESGYDIVFVARSSENMPGFVDIKKEMKFLLKKTGMFSKEINGA